MLLFEDFGVDAYLCGHIHKTNWNSSGMTNREIPQIVCGGNIVDGYGKAGFVLYTFCDPILTVQFFYWDENNSQWIIDNSVGRRVKDGIIDYELPRFKESMLDSKSLAIESINEDEFKNFIIDFAKYVNSFGPLVRELVAKDVNEKFENMKCNKSVKDQYNNISNFFPTVNLIMEKPTYLSLTSRAEILNLIWEEYNKQLGVTDINGTDILESMVDNIFSQYSDKINYPKSKLKLYIKILIYWFIYECDIYNDKL